MQAIPHASSKVVGIDDMAAYIPSIYLPIETLAQARDLEYAKLNKGLGLTAMSLADAREDAATMMANAIWQLLQKNDLAPQSIGRIYLGTESALDGAKPTATYALEMLSQRMSEKHGEDCFLNCDVVDLTFACIGAVDAMQNTLDWVRGGQDRIGIVVAADLAKYELGSGGEYTQGAGAVAVLIKENPRLLAFEQEWGVATRPVHDFFKPRRRVARTALVSEVLHLANRNHVDVEALIGNLDKSLAVNGVIDSNSQHLDLHRDTPVFDGPYSNDCYQQRIGEALEHFRRKNKLDQEEVITDGWARLIFHLPYAYQARRMFGEIFLEESQRRGDFADWSEQLGMSAPNESEFEDQVTYRKAYGKYLRAVTKTSQYRAFVADKIERGERASSLVGNLYTASIFLSLMSSLEADWQEGNDLHSQALGFFAYGSGSKSKVFSAQVQSGWKEVVENFGLMQGLEERTAIDYATYEALHRGHVDQNIDTTSAGFYLNGVHDQRDNQEGARTYGFAPVSV